MDATLAKFSTILLTQHAPKNSADLSPLQSNTVSNTIIPIVSNGLMVANTVKLTKMDPKSSAHNKKLADSLLHHTNIAQNMLLIINQKYNQCTPHQSRHPRMNQATEHMMLIQEQK